MLLGVLVTSWFLLVLPPVTVLAQDTLDNSIEQKLENLAEISQNEETDYSSLLESQNFYRKHPLNLNQANSNELSQLGILDELQISNLLNHIEKNGKLLTVYELQSIDGFDLQTITRLLPCITIADATGQLHVSAKDIVKNGKHEFIFRGQQILEEQTGFSKIDSSQIRNAPNSRYIGSPQKIYSRYRFTYGNNVSAGITAEKDAGELFFKRNNPYSYSFYDSLLAGKQHNGFDFYSAHIYIKNIRKIRSLAIGDYQVGFGQGLTIWSGLAAGKSSDAVSIKRFASGLRPYTSADENRFMRGVAFTEGIKNMEATGFISRKKADANVLLRDSLNEYNALSVSSIQETGLHTTPSEIADKDAITQTVVGGNLSLRKRKYSLGLSGVHTFWDAALIQKSEPYAQFAFSGKHLSTFGGDYSLLVHNFNFFGEAAMSSSSVKGGQAGFAYINGCIISLDPKLSLSILHRNFQKEYQSLFANTFAESSAPANEQGLYFGITIKPIYSITLNAYYDHFQFPWLKYQVNAPSDGSEYLVQINYTPSKKVDTYFRIKQKDKFVNSSSADEIDFIIPYRQMNCRWNIDYQISPSIKLRNRIETLSINKNSSEKENGYLIYQDVTWKKMGSKLSLAFRYTVFDTKSYDSRLYAFETDIPGAYSIPSFYYKGSRTYLMIHYDIARSIEVWLRWGQTYYADQKTISAGTLNEIQGNTKTEVKAEIKLKF